MVIGPVPDDWEPPAGFAPRLRHTNQPAVRKNATPNRGNGTPNG